MIKSFKAIAILCLIPVLCGFQYHPVDQSSGSEEGSPPRKFYEYPGDYGQEVQQLMDKFKDAFGYELIEFGEAWRTDQIEKLHAVFSELPPTFYKMPGFKGLYRLSRIMADSGEITGDEIPAATLPPFITIYKSLGKSYQVLVADQDPRVEFYTPLFYEDEKAFKNIVQHEMAHAFDMVHGFPSFSAEWLAIANFRILNIPALDAKPGSDFLYTFLNDAGVDNYAPVSLRHLPTYSRQNLQEDFANSVAAYINYPYFRYSHPARYRFLKEKVFAGKEYFSADDKNLGFDDKVLADFKVAMDKKDWQRVTQIIAEVSRGHYPKLESAIVSRLREEIDSGPAVDGKDLQLSLASCLLQDPEALELRKNLIIKKRVSIEKLLKNERCFRSGRDNFQKNLVKWAPANVHFFQEKGQSFLQFLDPVLGVAHSRGYNTQYVWRLLTERQGSEPVAGGNLVLKEGGNGSVKIDLAATAENKFVLPEGQPLVLELGVMRMHPRQFDTYNSEITKIRFVMHPGFNYQGPERPNIRVMYPFRAAYKDKF
ncbi:MAG: hypothetical protein O3A78_05750 [Nitrospinae bacterium]|nr:hypothetical protein [Nitrospinota bacterium]MDA1109308.1 hypothetical protein [Nitrospinota bacterium]